MNDLKAMRTFVEVARQGSFAAAAKALGLSTSSTSRLVINLEEWLGVQLIRRSPRQVVLTEAGTRFLERCTEIVNATDDLKHEAQGLQERPAGVLNIAAAAHPMRRLIAPLVPIFLQRYPEISLNIRLQNEQIDLLAEGIDVAIRIGHLSDSSLIVRKCGEVVVHLTASPEFIAQHGMPPSIDRVRDYPCLSDMAPSYGRRWPIGQGGEFEGPVTVNDGEIVHQMTLAGLGISLLPDFFVRDDIVAGRLVDLFPEEINFRFGMYLIYSATRNVTPAVRAFVDFIAASL
ncbi:LysR family transcriptional regulator [Nisaea sp.]|uniref:LysR family transcriptional regulator n=1 Tax=Nisaea sp. TaxID=2024842 RepID=UPI002B2669DE|nr:LysR family transcriptional regulator [Nisaea sp.]